MHLPERRTRRQFLADSMAAAAGTLIMTHQADASEPTSRPAWPIACRDAHLPETGKPDIFTAMDAVGVEALEAMVTLDGKCPGLFGPDFAFSIADSEGIRVLRDTLARHEKSISAFCLMNQFDRRLAEEIKCIEMTARAAVEMGVPAIRIDVVPHEIKDESEFLDHSIKTGKRIIDATKGMPVRFGVENHGRVTNKPEFLRKLFDGIGSDRYGLTLDTANFYWFGHPLSKLYEIYRTFAANACHTHCKSIGYPEDKREVQREIGWEYGKYACPVYEGDIDFREVASILRSANYRGDLCIENESLGRFPEDERGRILKREADLLRRLREA